MLKNITLSAEADLIERARQRVALENRSLNDAFRKWLETLTGQDARGERYDTFMATLEWRVDRKFSRDEMNAR